MGSYCNLVEQRIAIMDEQAALLEQFAGDMYAIIELCDGIKRKLEELEKEEDAYDKQAGLSLPLYVSVSIENYPFDMDINIDMDMDMDMDTDIDVDVEVEEYPETDSYCGDNGLDADDDSLEADDMISCMNAQLQEHFCSRRGCSWLGGCRVSGF